MANAADRIIRYKWDPRTETGYRLRYDAERAERGGFRCYRVEEWGQHRVLEEWGCKNLSEALGILQDFFDIDVKTEQARIQAQFSEKMQ